MDGLVKRTADLDAQLATAQEERDHRDLAASQRLDQLTDTIRTRQEEIDALRASLQAQIDQQRTAFEADTAARASEFKAHQEAAAEADSARVTAAEEAEEERIAAAVEADKAAREATDTAAKELLTLMETYRDQAKTLADMTSRHAVAGEYGQWAAHQAKAAFRWTLLAVVIGIGTVLGLVIAISSASNDTLQFTLYKTSISIVGLIVAGYAARQASEHRREERTAKRLALDLAALGPFLEQVSDGEQLRLEVAKRVFAPAQAHGEDGDALRLRIGRGHGSTLSLADLAELVRASRGAEPKRSQRRKRHITRGSTARETGPGGMRSTREGQFQPPLTRTPRTLIGETAPLP